MQMRKLGKKEAYREVDAQFAGLPDDAFMSFTTACGHPIGPTNITNSQYKAGQKAGIKNGRVTMYESIKPRLKIKPKLKMKGKR